MSFDYKAAAAIAGYEPVHTERLRDFAYAARQTWDELRLSKRENISLQREIRNLLGEIDVLKSSLLEAEAALQHSGEPVAEVTPQPVVDDSVLKLSELMRGLEIPPAAMTNPPNFFYVVGRAIADQAKTNATPQPVVPEGWKIKETSDALEIYDPKGEGALMWRGDVDYTLVKALLSAGKETDNVL